MKHLLRHVTCLVAAAFVCVAVVPEGPALARKKKEEQKDPIEEAFLLAYGTEDPAARSKAIDDLRIAPDPLKWQLLSTKVVPSEKRADVIYRTVGVLERIAEPEVIALMAKAAGSTKLGTDERVVYLESLARMPESTAAHAVLLKCLGDKDQYVRGMAAYSLGQHRAMDALEPLLELLGDPKWQVQVAALSALTKLRDKDVLRSRVETIVEYMESVSGRLRDDAATALHAITGRKLGREPEDWRKWLDEQATIARGEKPEKEEKPAPRYNPAYGGQKPHFYGIEVTSHRVVLILDMSLSMNDPIDIDKDRLRRETSRRRVVTGRDGGDDDDKEEKKEEGDDEYDIPWWRIKSRLDLARYQTMNLISRLEEDQYFDVIVFSTDVETWMGKLIPATSNNKQKAIRMIEALEPVDKTNTWGAIAAAFDLAANDLKNADLAPDEMYIVTDGAPSVGDIVDTDQIYDAAFQLWKVKQIRINCIGIGVQLPFMRKLCRKTGGVAKFFE